MAKSFFSTRNAVRRNIRPAPQRSVLLARPALGRCRPTESAAAYDRHPSDEAVGEIEIVRRQHDDGAVGGEPPEAVGHEPHRAVVEARERLVEQHQRRLVEKRAFQRKPLPHAA